MPAATLPIETASEDPCIASLWLIAPAVGVAMGLSPTEVGLLFTIFNIGGALAYLPAGLVADYISNRGRLLVMTFWWVAMGYGLAAMASDFWSLALLLAIAGMGNAAWHPIATGILTLHSRGRRAQALGVHAIGDSLAEVLSPLTAGLLISHSLLCGLSNRLGFGAKGQY
jgi:FSR family fosmidomycin resistance protein-like MFS transporter